jgi:hypothetical protein
MLSSHNYRTADLSLTNFYTTGNSLSSAQIFYAICKTALKVGVHKSGDNNRANWSELLSYADYFLTLFFRCIISIRLQLNR